jgi:hypothetical protein
MIIVNTSPICTYNIDIKNILINFLSQITDKRLVRDSKALHKVWY